MLPKSLYGNQLITQVVFLHYRQGIPMGRLCDQLGIGLGAVFEILHRMAALFRCGTPTKRAGARTAARATPGCSPARR